jgi:hypothetical protein
MNHETLLWAVFCVHYIAEHLHKSEAEVYELLTGKGNLLDTYILPYYNVLHTQGKDYIVEEIVTLMREEGILA